MSYISRKDLLSLIFIACVSLLIYSNTFNSSFHFDDEKAIVFNEIIKDGFTLAEIWTNYKTRFLPYLTFAINFHFNGLNTFGYHLFNILIHIFTAFTVYFLFKYILQSHKIRESKIRKRELLPLFVALIFASHPIQTQAVTYIVQRLASMVALFYLLSLTFYIKYALIRENLLKEISGSKSVNFTLALICAILAMFSKENAVTLPATLILTELFFITSIKERGALKKLIKSLLPFIIITSIIPILYLLNQSLLSSSGDIILPTIGNSSSISRWNYLITQFGVIAKYLRLLVLPINQCFDYDCIIEETLFNVKTLLSLFLLFAIVTTALLVKKREPLFTFGVLFFFITLSVESSFIPIIDVIFEHRLYLPMVGFAIAASSLVFNYLPKIKFLKRFRKENIIYYITITTFILPLSILTFNRNFVYKDEISFWKDVTIKEPGKSRAHFNLGINYHKVGELDKALVEYEKYLRIRPKNHTAVIHLANIHFDKKDYKRAERLYRYALKLTPKNMKVLLKLRDLFKAKGDTENTLKIYNDILKINPENATIHYYVGNLYMKMGEFSKSIESYKSVVNIVPNFPAAYNNMGIAYLKIGKEREGLNQFKKALSYDSSFLDAKKNIERFNLK